VSVADEARFTRACRAWTTGKYVVDRSIPTRCENPDGSYSKSLGYVVDGVLYIHPDREPLIKAAVERLREMEAANLV
jgi:hypothetical protein